MRPGAELEEAGVGDGSEAGVSCMRPGEEEAGVAVGTWVEEEVPASSSISSTSSIVSSAIIRFLEIIILARMNYSHVGRSWVLKFCRNWNYTRVL